MKAPEPTPERSRKEAGQRLGASPGAGPTGAELAGALAEVARHTLIHEFRNFDPSDACVLLLEGSSRVLPTFPPDLSAKARAQLEALGVEVRTDTMVTDIDETGVHLGEERITARTVLWAAGVQASPLGRTLGVELDGSGRVTVEADLSVPGHPSAFVVGDLANVESDGRPVPGLAPAAVQGGRHAAENILRILAGKPSLPFCYRDRGTMATLGRMRAVAILGGSHLSGLLAWLAWLFIHILFLIGFRNRAVVMFEWAKSYLTYQRSARLVLDPPRTEAPEKQDRSNA